MDIEEAYILDAIDHHKEVITGLTMRLLLLRERKKCGMFDINTTESEADKAERDSISYNGD